MVNEVRIESAIRTVGAMLVNGEATQIKYLTATGQYVYQDESGGYSEIHGLVEREPLNMRKGYRDLANVLQNTDTFGDDTMGIIFCNGYVYVIASEFRAYKRSMDNMTSDGELQEVDCLVVYEGEELFSAPEEV